VITLTLPWPSSTNHSHHYGSGRKFLSKKTKEFREKVQEIVIDAKCGKIEGRIAVFYAFYPPDKRRRDIDNLIKQLFDALVIAGVMKDDCQVTDLHVRKIGYEKGGSVLVTIEKT